MAATTKRSRAKVESRQLLVRVLFAIIVLVPVVGLSVQVRQSTAERQSFGLQERRGIEYLSALGPLTAALTQAQSAAVGGGTVNGGQLNDAVAGVAAVDARLGDTLHTHERWTDLRTKVERLSGQAPSRGRPAFDAYREVTDLLLAHYDSVRHNSDLIRDPDADAFNLQDGVAEGLPEFLVAAGRFTDLALIYSTSAGATNSPTRAVELGNLLAAQAAVNGPAEKLTNDVQAAVAASSSPTLGSNLFNLLDRLRLTIDALSASAVRPDGQVTTADAIALAGLRNNAVEAVNPLHSSALAELDKLIVARLDRVEADRTMALAALILAVVIAVSPVCWLILSRLRARRRPALLAPPGRHGRPDEADGPAQIESVWSAPAGQIAALPERERSGVSR